MQFGTSSRASVKLRFAARNALALDPANTAPHDRLAPSTEPHTKLTKLAQSKKCWSSSFWERFPCGTRLLQSPYPRNKRGHWACSQFSPWLAGKDFRATESRPTSGLKARHHWRAIRSTRRSTRSDTPSAAISFSRRDESSG